MMKGRQKTMRTIREVLRLHFEHALSQRAIARACAVSPTTVGEYITLASKAGLDGSVLVALDDAALKGLLSPEETPPPPKRPLPDFTLLQKELKRKGVTLQLLWEEYRSIHSDGYGRTQFFDLYRAHTKTVDPVMRFTHKAGEKLFVDFSGDRPSYVDRSTGEIIMAELFVAVMGASDFTYAVAVPNQQIPNWLKCHVKAFEYIKGCPVCVVPDNLKSGIKTACRYDPETNPAYAALAAHYGVAVIPARAGKPRDKAKVENGVLNAQRRILGVLRDRTFFSLSELNDGIAEALDKLNDRPMQGVGRSRRELFTEVDQPALSPLPEQRFELREWRHAAVNIDYHIAVQGNFYSVHYSLIGREVGVWLSSGTVEICLDGARIASHVRSYGVRVFVTDPAHRPPHHQRYLEWTPERMRRWGESIGPKTGEMVAAIIAISVHSEQSYRRCLGLLRLAKTHGPERLELACIRSLRLGAIDYQSVKNTLNKRMEAEELRDDPEPQLPLEHVNIRGETYYETCGGAS
jgi:transposase